MHNCWGRQRREIRFWTLAWHWIFFPSFFVFFSYLIWGSLKSLRPFKASTSQFYIISLFKCFSKYANRGLFFFVFFYNRELSGVSCYKTNSSVLLICRWDISCNYRRCVCEQERQHCCCKIIVPFNGQDDNCLNPFQPTVMTHHQKKWCMPQTDAIKRND